MKVGAGKFAVLLERGRSRSGSSTAGRELGWGLVLQRAVWPVQVVVILPQRAQTPGRSQTLEFLGRQELISQATVEALGIAVLPR